MTQGHAYTISVIIPTRNRPERLRRAIESVLSQTLRPLEIIVVDDGSQPPVAGLFEDVQAVVRILRHEESQGAPAARNAGLLVARGDLVAFLDDDDLWLPDKLRRQEAVFAASSCDLGLVFCGEALTCDGVRIKELPARWEERGATAGMLFANLIGGTSVALIRRDFALAQGGFDEALVACQDWDFWLRLANNHPVACLADILVEREIHGEQISTVAQRRIAGRKAFLQKHRSLLAKVPNALAQHLRRIGCLCYETGSLSEARKFFWASVKARPFSRNSWLCLAIDLLCPRSLARGLLSRYAVSHFGSAKLFH